jgi:hypothetical protein
MNRKVLAAVIVGVVLLAAMAVLLRRAPDADAAARRPVAAPPPPLSGPPPRPRFEDPRLASMVESPQGSRVEWVPDPQGRLMREMDADPASPGYRKPLRDYLYNGERVTQITRYRYQDDGQVEISTARIAYAADGSLEQVQQASRREAASSVP